LENDMTDFNTAATAALLQSPFFGQLLMKVRHVAKPDLQPATLAISQDTLYYAPQFLEKCNDAEGVFAISHEMMHAAWMHLPRMKHYGDIGIGPDGKKYDHKKMNIACDYAVNDALRESGFTLPRKEVIEIYINPKKYPYTMTPEEIYCLLTDEECAGGGSFDGHIPPEGSGDASEALNPNAITAADVIRAGELAKAVGTLPAGIDRLLGEMKKPQSSPWAMLRRAVISSLRGYDTTTWRRPQRRMLVRGIGMPGPIAQGAGKIGIVGDTSGSIDREMLELFGRHIFSIMSEAHPQEVRIYWTDARVNQIDIVKNMSGLRKVFQNPIKGGGGTDMPKGVDLAIAEKCDCVIVLTDGYTPFGKPHKKPVIWAITTAGVEAPHGTSLHITG
jgi:predicted metal-dependent peptidase